MVIVVVIVVIDATDAVLATLKLDSIAVFDCKDATEASLIAARELTERRLREASTWLTEATEAIDSTLTLASTLFADATDATDCNAKESV